MKYKVFAGGDTLLLIFGPLTYDAQKEYIVVTPCYWN